MNTKHFQHLVNKQDDSRAMQRLLETANEIVRELKARQQPNVHIFEEKSWELIPTNSAGHTINIGSIDDENHSDVYIYVWYDKWINGRIPRFWFGIGHNGARDEIQKLIDNSHIEVDIILGNNSVNIVNDISFVNVGSPSNIFGKTIKEVFDDEDNAIDSYLGIYKIDGELHFASRAADLIEIITNTHSMADSEDLPYLRQQAIDSISDIRRERFRSDVLRSAIIKKYILARAEGKCEACIKPAPFNRQDGTPYLEPHHIKFLSDGGIDHPENIGAICPTCHRQIHYGIGGEALNMKLRKHVGEKEGVTE